jgi:hypothetical protein
MKYLFFVFFSYRGHPLQFAFRYQVAAVIQLSQFLCTTPHQTRDANVLFSLLVYSLVSDFQNLIGISDAHPSLSL